MLYSMANLGNDNLDRVKSLENDVGKTMIAFSGGDYKPTDLTEDQLAKIKSLESSTGLVLIAINT